VSHFSKASVSKIFFWGY